MSNVRAALSGRTRELERLAVELYARGLSTRAIEDTFTDETGRRLLSRAAVSEITEKLWAEYEDFCKRDLSEHAVAYLFIDGIAERLRPGQRREAVLAAWGIGEDGRKSLLGLMAGSKEEVERFIHQRVMDVIATRDGLDAAKQKATDATALVTKQRAEVDNRRTHVADLQSERPTAHVSAPPALCHGLYKGKPVTYACKTASDDRDSETTRKAQEAFDARLATAPASLTEAEAELTKLQSADGMTADADVLAAQKAVQEAAANSTMYRTAATWYGVPVKDLTDDQFERFKRIAVAALAGAVALGTMMLAFISHATPRNPANKGKSICSIRACIARKRKNVVRIVEKVVEVEKHVFVDRPVVIEKRVDVPGPERIVVKHIHVPIDAALWPTRQCRRLAR